MTGSIKKISLPGESKIRIGIKPKTVLRITMTSGSTLATILSYSINHSIGWAILHSMCSWAYVIYFAFTK